MPSTEWGGLICLGHSCRDQSPSRTGLLSENYFFPLGCGFPLINHSWLRVRGAASPLILQPHCNPRWERESWPVLRGGGAVDSAATARVLPNDLLQGLLPSPDRRARVPRWRLGWSRCSGWSLRAGAPPGSFGIPLARASVRPTPVLLGGPLRACFGLRH